MPTLDDGAVFYVNGAEAKRVRMAAGVVTNLTIATGQPPGGDALSPDLFTAQPGVVRSGHQRHCGGGSPKPD